MKETPKRRITFTSSSNEKPANQLGCRVGERGAGVSSHFPIPFYFLTSGQIFKGAVQTD
jgi:hypothetical protein